MLCYFWYTFKYRSLNTCGITQQTADVLVDLSHIKMVIMGFKTCKMLKYFRNHNDYILRGQLTDVVITTTDMQLQAKQKINQIYCDLLSFTLLDKKQNAVTGKVQVRKRKPPSTASTANHSEPTDQSYNQINNF